VIPVLINKNGGRQTPTISAQNGPIPYVYLLFCGSRDIYAKAKDIFPIDLD